MRGRCAIWMALAATGWMSIAGGCCWRRAKPDCPCPPYVSQQKPIAGSPKLPGAGVVVDFHSVVADASQPHRLLDQIAREAPIPLDLLEVTQLAAANSSRANTIEAERQALCCQTIDEDKRCAAQAIDLLLSGQVAEQRNRDAGDAGEAFLRLVETELLKDLADETRSQMADWSEALDRVAAAGFATAQARNRLASQTIELEQRMAELTASEQRLQFQLSLLLGAEPDQPVLVQPVYELQPAPIEWDAALELERAVRQRPGIQTLEYVLSQNPGADVLDRLANLTDSRLGRIASRQASRRAGGLQSLWGHRPEPPRPDRAIRGEQAHQILENLKHQAQVETAAALIDAQTAFDRLVRTQQNLDRLKDRRRQLEAAQKAGDRGQSDVSGQGSTRPGGIAEQLNENWIEIQQARGEQIRAAINQAIARLRLLQAQGALAGPSND